MNDKNIHSRDLVHLALDSVLTEILGDVVKEGVLRYIEVKHDIAIEGKKPMNRKEVAEILEAFFGYGGNLILAAFEKRLKDLESQKVIH